MTMNRIHRLGFARKRKKYGNAFVASGNERFDSKFEKKVHDDLLWRQKAGEVKKIERQRTMRLYAYGAHICDYKIDFVVHRTDGLVEYVEAKGFPTAEWRIKWKLFEAQMKETNPNALLIIITRVNS